MKHVLACTLVLTLLLACGTALAYEPKVWDDYSWWATSGAQPDPVKDAVRSGYWWWPTEPASNADDSEAWGNRGVVYHIWQPAAEKPAVVPPTPAVTPPPAQVIQKPVLNNVLFDFDKSVLKPEGKAETDKVVDFMKNTDPKSTVLLQGHTCDIGTDAYNMGLGQRRADSVKKYLLESGVPEARISTKSFGESQPAVPNTSKANRSLNRRVVFEVTLGQ